MSRNLVILLGASALVVGLVARATWPGKPRHVAAAEPEAAEPSEPTPRLAEVSRGEVAWMRDELGRLRSELEDLRRQKASAQAEDDGVRGEDGNAEARAQSDRRWHEHMAEVATTFEREPRDARWSQVTSQLVAETAKKDPAFAALVGAVECRSATCRVELAHDDEAVVDKQLPLFLHGLGEALPRFEADHTIVNGKARYTLYLSNARTLAAAAPPSP